MKCLFEGCGVALATPFINNKVDYISLKKLIEHCIAGNVDAIIVLGTTGEASTISFKERAKIIKLAKKIIQNNSCNESKKCKNMPKSNEFKDKITKNKNKPIKLIVGTGSNNLTICEKLTDQAKQLGADGVLIVTPYYNKTTQEGIIKFYDQLAKKQIPIIMYNVPSRTGLNIEIDTMKKIVDHNPMIYGIKESNPNIDHIIALHKSCKNKIAIYSGEDHLNYIFYCLGASGTISVTANIIPDVVKNLYQLTNKNQIEEAKKLYFNIMEINKSLFLETNPIPIKYALKRLDIIKSDEVRPPLTTTSSATKKAITTAINNIILPQ